ncbi:MAG: HAMP domain-containing sensor histidine kinase [Acidimicrobiales bacterium]
MKRRLVISFLGVTTVVLILLAVPMGYLLQRVASDETKAQLAQQASYVLDQVTRSVRSGEALDPVALGNLLPPDTSAKVVIGGGDPIQIHTRPLGELISTTVRDDDRVVTVFASANPVRDRVQRPLVILAGLGLAGLLTTWLLAQAEARRLGQPLRELADTAARLGSGDFSVTAPRSGIPELDSLATTLDASAARIDALVRAERSFNRDAGHQLRSALTGLRLRLEELVLTDDPVAAGEAVAAIEQADRLSDTIDALLRLSRTGRAGVATRFDLRGLVANHVGDVVLVLRRRRRRIVTVDGPELHVEAAQGAVGQALDVLLWNATRHGTGTVTVALMVNDGWAELTVADEGTIDPSRVSEIFVQRPRTSTHGIGLPLARRVIEAEGGRLDVAETSPTTFRIRLPLPS